MALDRQIARLAKILVDSDDVSFDEAQAKLRGLTMEIVVGGGATSPAAHAAILTAVSVASRTFVGGVRVTGKIDRSLNSALPLSAGSLAEAAFVAGASSFDGCPSRRIIVDADRAAGGVSCVSPWWTGWRAGVSEPGRICWDAGANPLPGIAAGALAVGAAFRGATGGGAYVHNSVDLWPVAPGEQAPGFGEVFLPGALWLVGLGNLGQAFLWALAALPYKDPRDVALVVQDRDRITEENWATSVLVKAETYGEPKTRVAERWAMDRGFDVRRIDRRLLANDRLDMDDPRLALSGVDSFESRRKMADVGFECIVDAGLGRTAADFDRYRVTVFDRVRRIETHFAGQQDRALPVDPMGRETYRRLASEIGPCGTAAIGGAAVAAPYVSALVAAVVVARTIAVASGCACSANEVGRLSQSEAAKLAPLTNVAARGIGHAGNPVPSRG